MGWREKYEAYMRSLNDWQEDVVDHLANTSTRQPLRVIAAAGSGKTRTSIGAVAKILNEGVIAPQDMLVTTFTKKAAGELEARLTPLVEPAKLAILLGSGQGQLPRLGTFHRIGGRYMTKFDLKWRKVNDRWVARKKHAAAPNHLWAFDSNIDVERRKAGLPSADFMFRDICGASHWTNGKPKDLKWLPGFEPFDLIDSDDPNAPTARDYGLAIGVLRAYGFTPGDVLQHSQGAEMIAGYEGDGLERIVDVWAKFNEGKKNLKAYDFADVLTAYWKRGRDKAKLVIVDEAQDNDAVQLGLAADIARRGVGKFALIGDVRQAIYSWRGAVPEIMATADVEYRAATKEIPTNYRSGRLIVALGNRIALNPETFEPEPWAIGSPSEASRRDPVDLIFQAHIGDNRYPYSVEPVPWRPGTEQPKGTVRVTPSAADPLAEAQNVAAEIIQLKSQGVSPGDMAVLVRTNAVGTLFELGLISQRVPVMRLGASQSFFDRKIVADAMAYVALAYEDDTADLQRIFNKPKRKVHQRGTLDYLRGRGKGRGALNALDALAKEYPRMRDGYADLVADIEHLRKAAKDENGWHQVIDEVTNLMAPQGLHDDAEGGVDTSSDTDRELLDVFLGLARGFEGFTELRRWADKLRDPKNVRAYSAVEMDQWTPAQRADFEHERKERVIISSIHKSKGIEWRFVWVSASDGVFPHARTVEKPARLAEERRLFYVAVTRAADVLTITSADETVSGRRAGPSPFIADYVTPLLHEEGLTLLGVPKKQPVATEVSPPLAPSVHAPQSDQERLVAATLIAPWEIAAWRQDGFTLTLPKPDGRSDADIDVSEYKLKGHVGYQITHNAPGVIRAPAKVQAWRFHKPEAKHDVLRIIQDIMREALAWRIQQGIGEPRGPAGVPYVPPPTSPPPGSRPRPADAEWRAFIVFVRDQPGEARPGMTWHQFATVLTQQKASIMGHFGALQAEARARPGPPPRL